MTSIRWTTVADDELEVHVKHIREDNPKAARAMAQSILDRVTQLRTFPNMGRPGIMEGSRELIVGSYIVAYWLLPDDIAEILHIWHGAQDWQ